MSTAPEDAEDLRSVPGWRRTGLVLGWGAVACVGAGLFAAFLDGPREAAAVLLVAAFVTGLVALGFLQRSFSVPGVADDPSAVRARRWSEVAVAAWGSSVLLHVVVDVLLDRGGTWLDVVRALLGAVLVVAYVGMLVLAGRWRPRGAQL